MPIYDGLSLIPLGGQSEIGQVLWAICYGDQYILVDAGAAYPIGRMPGVDLLLPNTNFLEANQDKILALLLTNGHEEHSGAVDYLLHHLKIPRIMGPRFVSTLVSQNLIGKNIDVVIDTSELRHPYQIGCFTVEWIQVNDAIADACALLIETPAGKIVYTSSFKLDQTPVDTKLLDIAKLAQEGDQGVLLLISDSAGIETTDYTLSEKAVISNLEKYISAAKGRVVVIIPGTNTHRLQILFDLAYKLKRKVVLSGEILVKSALVAAITGNLNYDRQIEASLSDLSKLKDEDVLIIATGREGDALNAVFELAWCTHKEIALVSGDTVIYSAAIYPGRSRQMAMILDQLLSMNVKAYFGVKDGVHVLSHAGCEELKLILSVTKPRFFIPAIGEGRHIMNHAKLAMDWGMPPTAVFPLQNGQVLEIVGDSANIADEVESQAVLYNRDQGEKVTTSSVKERKNLSIEGVLTIGLAIGPNLEILSGPTLEANASGYLYSSDWLDVKDKLKEAIEEQITLLKHSEGKKDVNSISSKISSVVTKMIKSSLQAKPTVQVIIQEITTSCPE